MNVADYTSIITNLIHYILYNSELAQGCSHKQHNSNTTQSSTIKRSTSQTSKRPKVEVLPNFQIVPQGVPHPNVKMHLLSFRNASSDWSETHQLIDPFILLYPNMHSTINQETERGKTCFPQTSRFTLESDTSSKNLYTRKDFRMHSRTTNTSVVSHSTWADNESEPESRATTLAMAMLSRRRWTVRAHSLTMLRCKSYLNYVIYVCVHPCIVHQRRSAYVYQAHVHI